MRILTAVIILALFAIVLSVPPGSERNARSFPSYEVNAPGESTGVAANDYTCPMHPSVHRSSPGACPVCGMTLVKRTPDSPDGDAQASSLSLRLTPNQKILAGVEVSIAERKELTRTVHAAGQLEYQENLHHPVTARFAGRVEELFVTSEGQHVRKGDRLLTIYSPDLLTALNEYRAAGDAVRQTEENAELINEPALSIAAESKKKLLLLGLTENEINAFVADTVRTAVTIYAQVPGIILKAPLRREQYINTGELLFDVAETNSLWLTAHFYETDAPFLKTGLPIRARFSAHPGHSFAGMITFVSDRIDPESRTLAIRATVANPEGEYRLGEYADLLVDLHLPSAIVVPASAVISRGGLSIVWVEQHPSEYEPRHVTSGENNGATVQIISGLNAGERVVVHGGYLLDSESQLQHPDSLSGLR